MITITNGEVKGLIKAINDLFNNGTDLPFKFQYALGKSKRLLKPLDETINDLGTKRLEQYAKKNKYGVLEIKDEEKRKAFTKDYNEILPW